MATITSSASQVYEGSAPSSVKIVGYNARTNYVARYSFVSPAIGASGVSWSIPRNYIGGGTAPTLRWYITTSSTSHINAGASTGAYHGTVTATDVGGGSYTFTGSADIVLLPSTTYYLWIFPATTTYGFYNLTHSQAAAVTTSGASYSEISIADSVTLGAEQTISVTRYSTGLTHTITYVCGNASGTICTKSASTSIKWTPPLSLAIQNTTGTTVSITLTIETFSGSTSIGIRTKTIVASIPASVKPSCQISVSDDTGNAEIYGGYVVGISKLKVKITPTLAYGSPIATYRANANGATYTTDTFITDAVKDLNPFTVSATVTDKRGRSDSASTTLTILDYAAPVVSLLKVNRCDADGTENDQGEYVKVTFSGSVTPLNNKNAKSCKLEYKKSSAMIYTVVELIDFESSYTVTNGTYIFAADTGSSYDVRLTITDAFYATAKATSASTAAVIMHWKANGHGMGVGKVAEEDDTLDVGWKIRAREEVIFDDPASATNLLGRGSEAVDLNEISDTGIRFINLANCENVPASSGYGILETMLPGKGSGAMFQRFTFYNTGQVWVRTYTNRQWYEWFIV